MEASTNGKQNEIKSFKLYIVFMPTQMNFHEQKQFQ